MLHFDTSQLEPLAEVMLDPTVDRILIDSLDKIYIERIGQREKLSVGFRDEDHYGKFVEYLFSCAKVSISLARGLNFADFENGMCLYVFGELKPSVVIEKRLLAFESELRRNSVLHDLIARGLLDYEAAKFLRACIVGDVSILIIGENPDINAKVMLDLAALIPNHHRIFGIEEDDTSRLDALDASIFVRQGDLAFIASKYLQSDYLLVDNLQKGEIPDWLREITRRPIGFMMTLMADSPHNAVLLLESVAGALLVNQAIDIIVVVEQPEADYCISKIIEIQGIEDGHCVLSDVFERYEGRADYGTRGNPQLLPTGLVPQITGKLKQLGIFSPDYLFRTTRRQRLKQYMPETLVLIADSVEQENIPLEAAVSVHGTKNDLPYDWLEVFTAFLFHLNVGLSFENSLRRVAKFEGIPELTALFEAMIETKETEGDMVATLRAFAKSPQT